MHRIRLLGTVGLESASGDVIAVGSPQQQVILALLAGRAGQLVSTDALIEGVWGDEPPAAAVSSLRAQLSRLRRLLEQVGLGPLVAEHGGYRLEVDEADVDLHLLVAAAEVADSSAPAAERLTRIEQALALWRGEPFAGLDVAELVPLRTRAQIAAQRLEEGRGRALVELGRTAEAMAWAADYTERHPFRERGWVIRLRALYAEGRQVEALRLAEQVRRRFADELGLDPGPELAATERLILDHELVEAPIVTDVPLVPLGALREREWRTLADAVDDRARPLVAVVGATGSGKTTLLERLAHSGRRVVLVRCSEGAGALAPWFEVAERLGHPLVGLDPVAHLGQLVELFADLEDLVVGFDDLHRADPVSVAALAYLAPHLAPSVSLVVTSRPPLAEPVAERAHRIDLEPVADEELAVALGGGAAAGEVVARAEGNPLTAKRLARAVEAGIDPGVVDPRELHSGALRSVDRLDGDAHRLVAVVAVAGGRAPVGLLAEVLGSEPAALLLGLDEAASAGLLVSAGAEVAVTNDSVRDAVLDRLPPSQVRAIHDRVADALARDPGADPLRVAAHRVRALPLGDPDRALAAALEGLSEARRAGDVVSAARGAALVEEAAGYCSWPDPVERAELDFELGRALAAGGRYERAARAFERCRRSAAAVGRVDLQVRSLCHSIGFGRADYELNRGRARQLADLAARLDPADPLAVAAASRCAVIDEVDVEERRALVRRATATGDAEALGWAIGCLLVALTGDPAHAPERERLAVELGELAGGERPELRVMSLVHRYEAALHQGRLIDARRLLAQLEAEVTVYPSPGFRWYAEHYRAGALIAAGQLSAGLDGARRAHQIGHAHHGSVADLALVGILLMVGHQWRRPELVEEAVALLPDGGTPVAGAGTVEATSALVSVYLGDRAGALALVEAALDLEQIIPAAAMILAEVVEELAAAELAGPVLKRLETCTGELAAAPGGVVVGALDAARGRLRRLIGERDRALAESESGHRIEVAAGLRVAAARSGLLAAELSGDPERVERARREAAALGLPF